jgi:hypothetical protein
MDVPFSWNLLEIDLDNLCMALRDSDYVVDTSGTAQKDIAVDAYGKAAGTQ